MRVYWWTDVPNFGDALAPILVQRLTHHEPEWSPIEDAELIVIGSVLDALPEHGWHGIIAGAAKIRKSTVLDLSDADVRALRGPLSRRGSRTRRCLYADPGLLAPYLTTPPTDVEMATVVIPLLGEELPFDGTVIDLRDDPLDIVDTIARHQAVVSSSLHGIIVADAFGLPRRWEPARGADPFKFDDYALSMGTTIKPHVWARAPRDRVLGMQRDLLELFAAL